MHQLRRRYAGRSVLFAGALQIGILVAPGLSQRLPDAPGKDAVQKVCGGCHGMDIVTGKGRNRDQWTAVVSTMVARGAKGTESELIQIVNYLALNIPPAAASISPGAAGLGPAVRPKPNSLGVGPDNAQIVDSAAADRGKTIYIAQCFTCHGAKARGANPNVANNQKGPDLVRSITVLHDRYGNAIGPFLKKGHPTQSGMASAAFTRDQIVDLSHFLHKKVDDTLRSGPYSQILNVLTGDPKAGEAYFNGAGRCHTCHSVTGDLAGIGTKYDPPTLQSKFLFPRTFGLPRDGSAVAPANPVTVTVTTISGEKVSGVLVKWDDFNVSLRDAAGEYHSMKQTPALKVEIHDPYAGHVELLDQYTDKNMHDIVAYLESLK